MCARTFIEEIEISPSAEYELWITVGMLVAISVLTILIFSMKKHGSFKVLKSGVSTRVVYHKVTFNDVRKYERALSDARAESYEDGEWVMEHEYFISARWGRMFNGLFLDYGCGTGLVTRNLIAVGREVIATDISKRMCIITKNIYGVPVVVADVLNLPFKDQAFSVICISGVLHHLPQQLQTAFSEIGRCTSKALCTIESSKTPPPLPLRLPVFLIKAYSWFLYHTIYKRIGKYTFSEFERPLSPKELIRLCEGQGFKVCELRFFNHIPKLHLLLNENIRKHLVNSLISSSRGTDVEIIAKRR